jgi:hypothetical protein
MKFQWTLQIAGLALHIGALSGYPAVHAADGPRPVPLGVEGRMVVVLPVAGLQGRPVTDRSPVHVRVAEARSQGEATRYDLRYLGVRTGAHDLRDQLILADGTDATRLPPLPVLFVGLLPERHDGSLELVLPASPPRMGGYRVALGGAVLAWVLGSVVIWVRNRRRHRLPAVAAVGIEDAGPSSADRLRGWVEAAVRSELDVAGRARLERSLIAHWRGRVVDDSMPPSEAMARLKAHPEAGPLIRSLEQWLHRPPGSASVDVEALLAPYRAAVEASSTAIRPADEGGDAR